MIEELKVLKCPACGANVEIGEDKSYAFCEYCGNRIVRNLKLKPDNDNILLRIKNGKIDKSKVNFLICNVQTDLMNYVINNIVNRENPEKLKFLACNDSIGDRTKYHENPYFLIPIVNDVKKICGALAWLVQEIENRKELFKKHNIINFEQYDKFSNKKLPQILVYVFDIVDILDSSYMRRDIIDALRRSSSKGQMYGVQIIMATKYDECSINFKEIENLFEIINIDDFKNLYYCRTNVDIDKVENTVAFSEADETVTYNEDIIAQSEGLGEFEDEEDDDNDPLLNDVIESVIESGQVSTSFIQRRFKVGYARAGRIIDQMEARGVISGYAGSRPREILITKERWQELNLK